ncbi:hypothetical protein [Pseudomonas cremoricolorata]|uniref:Phosphatidylinositol diacylglycerol-lyase n=1 Tax=Pseudomonas cremoricolorata TaxID=157783 RepID=A0A089WPC7_9PSED|nr:hypothetical protein [Pseudomonas cremoricolorata]AIR89004.1 hypothetical protein LK03_06850 [Pseudomonas cremoricolorata]
MSNQHWMGDSPEIGSLPIDQLILPGSHDSGMDKLADSLTLLQETTQDVPCIEQIRGGIRVLDLRVRANREYTPDSPNRYKLFHLNTSGRTLLGDVIHELQQFYANPDSAREIIILDFHQLDNFSDKEHQWLLELLDRTLGGRIVPYALSHLTVGQLWREFPGKTVVIAYNHWQRGPHWPGVRHGWSGEDTLSTDELKAFMDQAAGGIRYSSGLRSIQCAKYNKVLYTADDFSDRIDQWFDSQDLDSYIQQFTIINTDWSLRSRIVEHCIHACRLRGTAQQQD